MAPVAGREVSIRLWPETAKLVSPSGGLGRTDGQGLLKVLFMPPAVYDQSALQGGDIVAEYPAKIEISLKDGQESWEWVIDDTVSYARYQDPLFQGLDRNPDPSPEYMTLTLGD
jgi:hypothetical protein